MGRLNYHHLYLFWILSKEGTFTKTAKKLSIAQSAVTAQIKSLEQNLGVTLIDRTNRRKPIVTEDGRSVLAFANSIFESGEELLNWTKQGMQQKHQVLRIGAISGLSRNLQYEFLKPIMSLKNVKVEVTTGDQEKLLKLVKDHHLDLILSSRNASAEGEVTLYSNVLISSPIVFVVSKSQKLRSAELKDYLSKKPLCLPGRSFEYRSELDAVLDRFKFSKTVLAEIDDIALLRIFALRSEAVVAIPEMGIRSEIESGQVLVISQPKGLEQKFYVISRQKKSRNPLVEMLIEKIKKV